MVTERAHCGGAWRNFFRRIRWWKAFTRKRKSAVGRRSRWWSCAPKDKDDGRSGLICRSRQAAGGHRPRGGRICAPEEKRPKLHRALPFSLRKDALVCRASGETDLSLLRLRRGRRRLQVRDGDGQVRLHGGCAGGGR